MAAETVTDADVAQLPKAHLHLHLTGGMRHATLLELAERYHVSLPERLADDRPEQWQVLGWARFQRLYDVARTVLRTDDDVRRLLLEIAADEQAAGSVWLELQVTPSGYAARFGDVVHATDLFVEAAAAAEAATGVGIRLVIAANRTRPPWEAEMLARIAVRHAGDRPGGVVGFGLSNDERRGPPEDFRKAFRLTRDAGLIAVPHAGELLGAQQVRRTVDALAPRRLGHGIRSIEDPSLLQRLAENGIACEVCPASNVALGVAGSHLDVPLRQLEGAGVPVVLAADDPLLFGSGLVEQYAIARDELDYDRDDLARLAATSVEQSTMPVASRAVHLAAIEDWRRQSTRPG